MFRKCLIELDLVEDTWLKFHSNPKWECNNYYFSIFDRYGWFHHKELISYKKNGFFLTS